MLCIRSTRRNIDKDVVGSVSENRNKQKRGRGLGTCRSSCENGGEPTILETAVSSCCRTTTVQVALLLQTKLDHIRIIRIIFFEPYARIIS